MKWVAQHCHIPFLLCSMSQTLCAGTALCLGWQEGALSPFSSSYAWTRICSNVLVLYEQNSQNLFTWLYTLAISKMQSVASVTPVILDELQDCWNPKTPAQHQCPCLCHLHCQLRDSGCCCCCFIFALWRTHYIPWWSCTSSGWFPSSEWRWSCNENLYLFLWGVLIFLAEITWTDITSVTDHLASTHLLVFFFCIHVSAVESLFFPSSSG